MKHEIHQLIVLVHSNDEDSSPCTFSVCKADDDICLVRNSILCNSYPYHINFETLDPVEL